MASDTYSVDGRRVVVVGAARSGIAAAAKAGNDAANSIMTSLQAQRESISGVSLDEESIQLIKFERAFQGAARYVSVVDGLIDEMLNLVK